MTKRKLKTWLKASLKEAQPFGRLSEMPNPQGVAIKATKRLGLLGLCKGDLFSKGGAAKTPQECAAVLCDCLAALNEPGIQQAALATNAELLTVRQTAQRYNIGERTLYRLLQQNELPNYGPGSSKRIKPADLERYLEEQAQPVVASSSLFD